MDRTQLIHMIRLISTAACVIEAEKACYEKSGFVMGYGIWAGKYGTRFAVERFAVSKEQGVFSGKLFAHLAALAHECFIQDCAISNNSAFRYDKITG